MEFRLLFVLVAYVTLCTRAFSFPAFANLLPFEQVKLQDEPLPQETLDEWISREEEIALERLLANIAPGGSNVGPETVNGTVIASPSRSHPDYYYQCTQYPLFPYTTTPSPTNNTTQSRRRQI
jgi:glucoamylase